jgi:hypothetical protein
MDAKFDCNRGDCFSYQRTGHPQPMRFNRLSFIQQKEASLLVEEVQPPAPQQQ